MKETLNKTRLIERNGFYILIDNTGTTIEMFESYQEYIEWFNNLD